MNITTHEITGLFGISLPTFVAVLYFAFVIIGSIIVLYTNIIPITNWSGTNIKVSRTTLATALSITFLAGILLFFVHPFGLVVLFPIQIILQKVCFRRDKKLSQ